MDLMEFINKLHKQARTSVLLSQKQISESAFDKINKYLFYN